VHFRRTPSLASNIVILLVSTAIGLGLSELLVRAFIPVRNIGPTFSVYDPYYGKVLKKNFSCVRTAPEFTMRFTTNSFGFRGPEPKRLPQKAILFLGDSFTGGYGVNDGEEFPALIRAALDKKFGVDNIEVVNAGSGNTGNGYWLKFLKTEAKRFSPRVVVLQVCENDFGDNEREQLFTLNTNGELIESVPAPMLEKGRIIQGLIESVPGLPYSYLVCAGRQVFSEGLTSEQNPVNEDIAVVDSSTLRPSEALTQRMLEGALELCFKENWPVLGLGVELNSRHLVQIEMVFRQHHASFLEIPAKRLRPDLYFRIDGHWNASGHAFVADTVLKRLETGFLMKPDSLTAPRLSHG
jgi:hypothetical protein